MTTSARERVCVRVRVCNQRWDREWLKIMNDFFALLEDLPAPWLTQFQGLSWWGRIQEEGQHFSISLVFIEDGF